MNVSAPAPGITRLTLDLTAPQSWGFTANYDGPDLLLSVRRPPTLNPARPLEGRVVTLDAGHGGTQLGGAGSLLVAEDGPKLVDTPSFPDAVKPIDSHVHLNTIVDADGVQRQILRDNMPFGDVGKGEFGTYFIGYAKDPSVTEHMLRNMFIGDPPGTYDRILDFSTALTGGLFFTPSGDWLDAPPDLPAADVAPSAEPTGTTIPAPADGSLGIGGLKER